MKKSKLMLFGLALAMSSTLIGCSSLQYPTFGSLAEGEKYNIGILLPLTHDALGKAVDGFVSGLNDGGFVKDNNINLIMKNAQDNADDQLTMAKSLMDTCVLTLGVGTGAAKDLKSSQSNKGSKNPILFTAVTDPVDAKLVSSLENKTGYVTGTSDAAPIEEQIKLIKEAMPEADKVGIFYTQSETNSKVQAVQAKAAIEELGMEAVVKTCTNSTDISTAISSLVTTNGLDAIYLPTDNNIAANMNYVKQEVKNKGILVVASEEGMLEKGAHITLSISYFDLGKRAGEMAVSILNGEKKPNEIPVGMMTKDDCEYVMSSDNLIDAGVAIPETLTSKFRDISVK